jgi:RNA polymerase sigma factor (sigma-70 family)
MSSFPSTLWGVVQEAREQKPDAWRTLFRMYHRPVERYLGHVAGGVSAADREILAQEVFVQLCTSGLIERISQEKGRFRDLLCKVALYTARHWIRDRKRGPAPIPADALDPAAPTESAEVWDREWQQDIVRKALDRLRDFNPRYFSAVDHYLAGKSIPEIAAAMAETELEVKKNLLFRGRNTLGELIRDEIRQSSLSSEEFEEQLRDFKSLIP